MFVCCATAYSKPIEGTGEPPMLNQGYANVLSAVWSMLLSDNCVASWSPVCRIVGNAVPRILPVLSDVGNETAEVLRSEAFAICMFMVLSVWCCSIVGNPHDSGTSDALDVIIIKDANMHKNAAMTILFTIYYPPLNTEYFRRYVIY
jgi:hypothetical protein